MTSTLDSTANIRDITDKNKLDSVVLATLKNNQFSSVGVISHLTKLSEKSVSDSFNRLLSLQKIYLSVGGLPKRYSCCEEPWLDTEEEYQESKRSNYIQTVEGTVVH